MVSNERAQQDHDQRGAISMKLVARLHIINMVSYTCEYEYEYRV